MIEPALFLLPVATKMCESCCVNLLCRLPALIWSTFRSDITIYTLVKSPTNLLVSINFVILCSWISTQALRQTLCT